MLANIIVLLPFLVALAMLIMPQKRLKSISILMSIALLGLSVFAYNMYKIDRSHPILSSKVSWIKNLNSNWFLDIDGMSMLMVLLTAFVSPLIFLSIREERKDSNGFFALIWTMIGAMLGVFTAKDGLLFYVFWELALIPIYFICLMWGGEHKEKITFKFFIYTLFGSLFMLASLLYLYQHSQSGWEIGALYEAGRSLSATEQNWVFWGLFLGFAIKMPIFPFHTWQADTYNVAPTTGTMLLSGIMSKMGTYGLIRWLVPMLPAGFANNAKLAIILSVITIVYASCIALVQKDMKRLMAWSSVAHIGLISAGIFSFTPEGINGAFAQMFAHGVNVVGLFFIVDIIINRSHTDQINALGGIRGKSPVFALYFLIILLGSVALPLTNGFVGEFLLLTGVFKYNFWLSMIAGLTVILGAVYMLRSYQNSMLGETNALTSKFTDLHINEKLVFILITVLIFVFGLFPNILIDLVSPGVEAIMNNNLSTKEIIQ
ncbi:MAG: hypothetical protein RLZZ546_3113 [Bacteroidota bacterium]|jgi:NADH-quinone oxidoreductase subunit M